MISTQDARNLARHCVEAITGRLTVSDADRPGELRLEFNGRRLFIAKTADYRAMCDRIYQAVEGLLGIRAQWPQQEPEPTTQKPAKVVRLHNALPFPGLPEMLEHMAEQARAGHLVGVLAFGMMSNGQGGQGSAGDMTAGDALHAFEMWKAEQYGRRD